jgi:hypothetical protein
MPLIAWEFNDDWLSIATAFRRAVGLDCGAVRSGGGGREVENSFCHGNLKGARWASALINQGRFLTRTLRRASRAPWRPLLPDLPMSRPLEEDLEVGPFAFGDHAKISQENLKVAGK